MAGVAIVTLTGVVAGPLETIETGGMKLPNGPQYHHRFPRLHNAA
jgi:hypothetical protein